MIATVTGLPELIAKLKKVNGNTGLGVEIGLKRGGLLIERKSQDEVPVDLGNLKASSFARVLGGKGFTIDVGIGYTAAYAVYVHENTDAVHGDDFNTKYADQIANPGSPIHSRGSGQKAKFLEDPARTNRKAILKMVRDEVQNELRKLGYK